MSISLIGPDTRWAIVIGSGLLLAVAGLLWRKDKRIAAVPMLIALLALLLVGIEALTGTLLAHLSGKGLDYNEYRWILLAPWGQAAIAIGLLAASLSVLFTAIAAWNPARPLSWMSVVLLRCGAVITAILLFLQPALELRQVARESNRVAILFDTSASMALRDRPNGPTRIERAIDIWERSDALRDAWQGRHTFDLYRFSTELRSTALSGLGEDASLGNATLLRKALSEIRRDYKEDELAGVIVFSDGVVTGDLAELGVGEVNDFARSLGVPIHSVWTQAQGIKDLAVSEVFSDEFAFVRTVAKVEATIEATGVLKQRVPVTLSSEGVALRRKWIELEPGASKVSVAFEFTPSHVGNFVYEISVPSLEGEAIAENNKKRFVIRVIRDKIRVLQVAGQPSWDVRALRGMLKQNPNVDLISFFILRTPEDIDRADNAELSLIPFPTQELFQQELPSFDLVVLQNFNYGPYGIGRYLESMRSYVEGGGGLMMLGGPLSFSSGGYANTPIAKALPVVLPSKGSAESLIDTKRFSPNLTELGQIHPVTALRYEREDNKGLWRSLPQLEGVNKVLRARKDAAVLAVHPKLRDQGGSAMPVIVAGNYGKGRSLAVTTDSLWRWGFVAAGRSDDDGRHYLKFWDNAIRWLISDPELRYLHVSASRNSYDAGDAAELRLRLVDQDYSPLSDQPIEITVSEGFDPKEQKAVHNETLHSDKGGHGVVTLDALPPGVYRVNAASTVRGRAVSAKGIFLIEEAGAERKRASAESGALRALSLSSDGSFHSSQEALSRSLRILAPKVVRVDSRRDLPLWNHWWLLLLAFGLLGTEWLLRQRMGSL